MWSLSHAKQCEKFTARLRRAKISVHQPEHALPTVKPSWSRRQSLTSGFYHQYPEHFYDYCLSFYHWHTCCITEHWCDCDYRMILIDITATATLLLLIILLHDFTIWIYWVLLQMLLSFITSVTASVRATACWRMLTQASLLIVLLLLLLLSTATATHHYRHCYLNCVLHHTPAHCICVTAFVETFINILQYVRWV